MTSNRDVLFNAYPDSCGSTLTDLVDVLTTDPVGGVFTGVYVLPSVFRSDLDRGFSVISYDINEELASPGDIDALRSAGIGLKLDLVLNHLSVRSPQFQDLLARGDASPWARGFIDWNAFWEGHGSPRADGCIVPDDDLLGRMFMRKPGLPVLRVPFPDGRSRFYWNTFYQAVHWDAPSVDQLITDCGVPRDRAAAVHAVLADAAAAETPVAEVSFTGESPWRDRIVSYVERRLTRYQGQMDLDARSAIVWEYYAATLEQVAGYGARLVRLDAFAYLHKEVGARNFFNEPGTWEYLDRVRGLADRHGLQVLPEIHTRHEEGVHREIAARGYPIYDFFMPGLVIHGIDTGEFAPLLRWFDEVRDNGYRTVTMLGCHDGIPVLDVKGLLPEHAIDEMIDRITARGGRVKNLYDAEGRRISYYQVNATYFSALGEDPRRMLMARALQVFAPGTPQVWYLDLFLGTNDYAAADAGGHKEINRTNLTPEAVAAGLREPVVRRQLELLRLRREHPAFSDDAAPTWRSPGPEQVEITWRAGSARADLSIDVAAGTVTVDLTDGTATARWSAEAGYGSTS